MRPSREHLAERWWRLAYIASFPLVVVALAAAVALAFVDLRLSLLAAIWVAILVGEMLAYRSRRRSGSP